MIVCSGYCCIMGSSCTLTKPAIRQSGMIDISVQSQPPLEKNTVLRACETDHLK